VQKNLERQYEKSFVPSSRENVGVEKKQWYYPSTAPSQRDLKDVKREGHSTLQERGNLRGSYELSIPDGKKPSGKIRESGGKRGQHRLAKESEKMRGDTFSKFDSEKREKHKGGERSKPCFERTNCTQVGKGTVKTGGAKSCCMTKPKGFRGGVKREVS